jgi:hypothetical protein
MDPLDIELVKFVFEILSHLNITYEVKNEQFYITIWLKYTQPPVLMNGVVTVPFLETIIPFDNRNLWKPGSNQRLQWWFRNIPLYQVTLNPDMFIYN